MSQAARRQYESIERAVRAADNVVGKAGIRVLKSWNRIASGDTTVTNAQRARFMRDVDEVATWLYAQRGADIQNSALYRAIKAETERAFTANYKVSINELDEIMKPFPWWQEQRQIFINGGISVARRDRLAQAYQLVFGSHVDKQRLLNARLFDPQRRWVDPQGYRLSDRIWKTGQGYRTAIDRTLQNGIRQGWSADRIARELRQYVDPAYAPVKYTKSGRVYRTGSTYRPNAASGARRIARTEIAAVHRQGAIDRAADIPGAKGVKWNLSPSHPKQDICDDYASADNYELGPGVYPADSVPDIPHPQCMCNHTAVQGTRAETRAFIVEKYRPLMYGDDQP